MANPKKNTTPAPRPVVSRGSLIDAHRANMRQYLENLPFNAQVAIDDFRQATAEGSNTIERLLGSYAEKAFYGDLILKVSANYLKTFQESTDPLAAVETMTKLRNDLNRELLDGCFRASSSSPMSNTISMWKGLYYGTWIKELDAYLKPYNDLLVMSEEAFNLIYN